MDICQLKYFVSAASIGNFTLAALENNISQSSFSKQIMNLENELGTELFVRKKRTIELTPAGEQFQEYADRILNTYEDMLRGMESYSAFQTLPVSIASIPVIQSYQIGTIIFDLKRQYPDIIFNITEKAESFEVLHALHKGECDFAIMRTDFLEKEKFDICPIVKDRLAAVVSEAHPLYHCKKISLEELKNDEFVMSPERSDLRRISQNACIAKGFRPHLGFVTGGNIELTLDFVEEQAMTYLAFENVIKYYVKNRKKCRVIPLEDTIESSTAFVGIKSRAATKAHIKVARYLEKKYRNEE